MPFKSWHVLNWVLPDLFLRSRCLQILKNLGQKMSDLLCQLWKCTDNVDIMPSLQSIGRSCKNCQVIREEKDETDRRRSRQVFEVSIFTRFDFYEYFPDFLIKRTREKKHTLTYYKRQRYRNLWCLTKSESWKRKISSMYRTFFIEGWYVLWKDAVKKRSIFWHCTEHMKIILQLW